MSSRLIEIAAGETGWSVFLSQELRGTLSTPALAVAFARRLSDELAVGGLGPRIRIYLSVPSAAGPLAERA